ncbi:hypothetical protein AYI68_g6912, partial [Smittium mucronatum]
MLSESLIDMSLYSEVSVKHMLHEGDHRDKVTYFIFGFNSDASDIMSKKLVFADMKVDLYQTV